MGPFPTPSPTRSGASAGRHSQFAIRNSQLFAALLLVVGLVGCGAAAEVRREFAPWRGVREAGVDFKIPDTFAAGAEGDFKLYRPAGALDALPFVGVAAVPKSAAADGAADLLKDFLPRRHDPEAAAVRLHLRAHTDYVAALETTENGVRGWTCLLEKNNRPVAVLLIGVPAHWPASRAAAFRDIVLHSAQVL